MMKTKIFGSVLLTALLGVVSIPTQAMPIAINEYAFNIDGVVSSSASDPTPVNIDISGFNIITGLGTITALIEGVGSHYFALFVDHEIDEPGTTYYNEFGAVVGSVAAGQSWEIDEPGWTFGDIYANFTNSALDNFNAVPAGLEEDVSMALGWDFILDVAERALITMNISADAPASGFYLRQTDPDTTATPNDIYFNSSLSIRNIPVPVPLPPTLLLMGIGLLALRLRRGA